MTSMPLPNMPGYSFEDPTRTNFNRSQIFGYKNGIPVVVESKGALPLASQTDATAAPAAGAPAEAESAPNFVPAWVTLDRKVLSFEGFFKEPVHESAAENFRVRNVRVLYYLEDDSMQVSEPKEENSGIPQGVFIKRHRIPKPDAAGDEFYTYNDLSVSVEIKIYGRTFRLTDADPFTRNFYEQHLATTLGPREDSPDNPYTSMRETQKLFATAKGTPYLSFPPNRKFDDLTQYVEAKLGMATHILTTDKLQKFLSHDRKVLRFFSIWDDSGKLFGDKRPFIVHYFLADDTVEVLEVAEPNSGRDPFPTLMKRCKLPKDTSTPGGPYVGIDDLGIGKTLTVYSKDLMLYAADRFTTEWFASERGEDLIPIEVQDPPPPEPMMEVPPHNGIGDPEDSLQNVLHLIAKPPKRDFKKFMELDRKILRFEAHMVTDKPEDVDRTFIIAVYLADNTVAVFEPPMRNSGIIGGKFLERSRATDPTRDGVYYEPHDFYVGATVTIYSQPFKIHKCDQYTLNFMEQNEFPLANADSVVAAIKSADLLAACEAAAPDGAIDVVEFRKLSPDLCDQQIIALLRKYDADSSGKINYRDMLA